MTACSYLLDRSHVLLLEVFSQVGAVRRERRDSFKLANKCGWVGVSFHRSMTLKWLSEALFLIVETIVAGVQVTPSPRKVILALLNLLLPSAHIKITPHKYGQLGSVWSRTGSITSLNLALWTCSHLGPAACWAVHSQPAWQTGRQAAAFLLLR